MWGLIRKNKGFASLTMMAMVGILGASLAYLGSSILNLKKFTNRENSKYGASIVLNSIVDYTIVGIRQRWCFSSTWLRDSSCNLAHSRNSERLLLDSKAIETITALGIGDSSTALTEISHNLSLSSFSQEHPLRVILDNLPDMSAQQVSITITRIENSELYSLSGEVHLKIKATMLSHSLTSSEASGQTVESSLIIFPQEVGGYALLVANDLRIGYSKNATNGNGNAVIPSSPKTSSSGGLIFESPVYVNNNIDLYSTDGSNYSNVTFSSDVVVGSGVLKSQGSAFTPNHSSAGDYKYSNMKSLGGFKKGISFLGERDAGLDSMAGITRDESPNRPTMDSCVLRNLARWDLYRTRESDLFVKKMASTASNFNFRLGLSKWNRFLPQRWLRANVERLNGNFYPGSIQYGKISDSGSNKGKAYVNESKPFNDDPIMRLNINISSAEKKGDTNHDGVIDSKDEPKETWRVQTELARDSFAQIQPRMFDTKAIQDHLKDEQNKLKDKEKDIKDKSKEVEDIADDIADLQKDIDKLSDEINDLTQEIADLTDAGDMAGAGAKQSEKNSKISQRNGKIAAKNGKEAQKSNKEQQLAVLESQKQAQEAVVAQVQAQLAEALDAEANPPTLKLETKPVYAGSSTPEFNQHTLKASFSNQKYFRADVNIDIETYDVGYRYGRDDRRRRHDDDDDDDDWNDRWRVRKEPHSIKGNISFSHNSATREMENSLGSSWLLADLKNRGKESSLGITTTDPIDPKYVPYGAIEEECTDNESGRSFNFANWDNLSFTKFTRKSWDFAHPSSSSDYPDTLDLDATSSAGPNIEFLVRSIVKQCIVHPDAELVAGFFACDRFEILPRSRPLKIVGSVITSQLIIDPTAMSSGIWWSNIYNPQAIKVLQDAKVLKTINGGSCSRTTGPIWHPRPKMEDFANMYSCSPISLRNQANPFTWTTIDPDCGLRSTASSKVICKNRHTRFKVKEVGRVTQ